MNKENVVCAGTHTHTHTHREILFGIKKEGDSDTCDTMNGPRGHHVKGKISARERHLLHCITYIWNQNIFLNRYIHKAVC